jgi:hypothetical protein
MTKIHKKPTEDQFENLESWINFYSENKKLPFNKIICSSCRNIFVSMKGRGKKVAFDSCNNDIKKVLTETSCKECKNKKNPPEKKKKEPRIETEQERINRIEKIRADIPKIDFNKTTQVLNLKDEQICVAHTRDSCLRPDIYLNSDRTCDICYLNKFCKCPIKKFSKNYEKKYK